MPGRVHTTYTSWHLCGIFVDEISTREQFAFIVYCYRVKAIFHNALCFTGILTKPPLLNTLSTEADVHGAQKVISNNGFRMANCFCCLTIWCALLTAVKHYNKSLEKLQDFFFKTKWLSFLALRPIPWSRGLHHWLFCKSAFVFSWRCSIFTTRNILEVDVLLAAPCILSVYGQYSCSEDVVWCFLFRCTLYLHIPYLNSCPVCISMCSMIQLWCCSQCYKLSFMFPDFTVSE